MPVRRARARNASLIAPSTLPLLSNRSNKCRDIGIVSCKVVKILRTLVRNSALERDNVGLPSARGYKKKRAQAEIDERIDLATDRTDVLARLVESAEVNIALAAHKAARAATRSEET